MPTLPPDEAGSFLMLEYILLELRKISGDLINLRREFQEFHKDYNSIENHDPKRRWDNSGGRED